MTELKDILSFASLLKGDDNEKIKLENEILDICEEIETVEKRFENEISLYHEKNEQKSFLNDRIKLLIENVEVEILKLQQVSGEGMKNVALIGGHHEKLADVEMRKFEVERKCEDIESILDQKDKELKTFQDEERDKALLRLGLSKNRVGILNEDLDMNGAVLNELSKVEFSIEASIKSVEQNITKIKSKLKEKSIVISEQIADNTKIEEALISASHSRKFAVESLRVEKCRQEEKLRNSQSKLRKLREDLLIQTHSMAIFTATRKHHNDLNLQVNSKREDVLVNKSAREEEIFHLNQEYHGLESGVAEMRHRVALVVGENEAHKSRLCTMTNQLQQLHSEELKRQIEELKTLVASIREKTALIQEEMSSENGRIQRGLQEIKELEKEKDRLGSALLDAQDARSRVKQDTLQHIALQDNLQREQESTRNQLQNIQAVIDSKKEQISQLRARITGYELLQSRREEISKNFADLKRQEEEFVQMMERLKCEEVLLRRRLEENKIREDVELKCALDNHIAKVEEDRFRDLHKKLSTGHAEEIDGLQLLLRNGDQEFQGCIQKLEEDHRLQKESLQNELETITARKKVMMLDAA